MNATAEKANQVVIKNNQPYLIMANGSLIPQVGFGTYRIDPADCDRAIGAALDLGIRHIDTAQMYKNEAAVGAALKTQPVAREDIFLTTKLNNGNHLPEVARKTFEQSLCELQVDYVDLFLIHWPLPMHYGGNFEQTWEVMLEFQEKGLAKTVGVSNFEPEHIDRLITATGVTPLVNQIEAHPYFRNDQVHQYNLDHSIITEAWSPLARGKATTDPKIQVIADELGRTPAQVVLRWALQKGWVLFPKSIHPDRIKENWQIFDFQLAPDICVLIDQLEVGEAGRTGRHPNVMDWLG